MTIQEYEAILELLLPNAIESARLMQNNTDIQQMRINEMLCENGVYVPSYGNIASFFKDICHSSYRIDVIKKDGRFTFLLDDDLYLLRKIDSVLHKHIDLCNIKKIIFDPVEYDFLKFSLYYDYFKCLVF